METLIGMLGTQHSAEMKFESTKINSALLAEKSRTLMYCYREKIYDLHLFSHVLCLVCKITAGQLQDCCRIVVELLQDFCKIVENLFIYTIDEL